jgi:predicted PurR-regulated permease PerM
MTKYSFVRKYNTVVFFAVLTVAVLVVAKDILIPMAWAFYFALVTYPIANRLERWRFNRAMSSLTIVLLLLVLVLLLILFFSSELMGFTSDLTLTTERVRQLVNENLRWIERTFGVAVNSFDQYWKSGLEKLGSWLIHELGLLGASLSSITLMFVYLFFFLYYRNLFVQFITVSYSGEQLQQVKDFALRSSKIASGYIRGTVVLTLLMAGLSLIVFWIFGVRQALFLAAFVAVLNIIPYVGNLIAFVVVFFITYITKDSLGTALGVLGCLYGANLLQENLGRPLIVGSEMDINAFFVFVSVVIGSSIWGISGMVLFIPVIAVIKIVLEMNPHWQAAAIFLGSGKPTPVTTAKTEIPTEK